MADEGGLPETIVPGVTGWAVARLPAAAAASLDRLEDPATRAAFSARAAEHGARCTWTQSAAAMAAVLEQQAVAA